MDALELLGYVKQEEDERNIDEITYIRDFYVYIETITIHVKEKEFCKTFNTWDADYINKQELEAVLEILEGTDK